MGRGHLARAVFSLFAITLLIAQLFVVAFVGSGRGGAAPGKDTVVICTVHGAMTVDLDGTGGLPSKPVKNDCPWCRLGALSFAGLQPPARWIGYELRAMPAGQTRLAQPADVVVSIAYRGRPMSPRAPPSPT